MFPSVYLIDDLYWQGCETEHLKLGQKQQLGTMRQAEFGDGFCFDTLSWSGNYYELLGPKDYEAMGIQRFV